MTLSMFKCQTRLMTVWTIGCFILLSIMGLQIIFGHYSEYKRDAVEWLLPAIFPTLSLVTGVWLENAKNKAENDVMVDKKTYRWVMSISILYLSYILIIFAIQPMVAKPSIEVLKDSSLVLAPIQGIMCASIGIFYTNRPKEQENPKNQENQKSKTKTNQKSKKVKKLV